MKKIMALFLFLISFLTVAHAAPQFKDYPVDVYKGKPRAFVVDKDTRSFRTRFKEVGRQVDFAGHYALGGFGCGTSCCAPIAVNLKSGKGVYLLGATTGCYKENGFVDPEYHYKPNSRLFIFAGVIDGDPDERCLVRYYVEQNGKLVLIDKQLFTKLPEQ